MKIKPLLLLWHYTFFLFLLFGASAADLIDAAQVQTRGRLIGTVSVAGVGVSPRICVNTTCAGRGREARQRLYQIPSARGSGGHSHATGHGTGYNGGQKLSPSPIRRHAPACSGLFAQ